jgi:hypothetical protein
MGVTADNVTVKAGMTIFDSQGRRGRVLSLVPADAIQHLVGGYTLIHPSAKFVVVMEATPDVAKPVVVFSGYYASSRGLQEKRLIEARNRLTQADESKRKAAAEIEKLTTEMADEES